MMYQWLYISSNAFLREKKTDGRGGSANISSNGK
jgi:hypothetical protein